MVAARNKARYQKEMAAQSWIGNMGKGGWSFLGPVFKILLSKVRMTCVGYAVRSEIARSTGCGQICINGYAVSQKFRAARTSNEAHNALSCGVAVFLQRTL